VAIRSVAKIRFKALLRGTVVSPRFLTCKMSSHVCSASSTCVSFWNPFNLANVNPQPKGIATYSKKHIAELCVSCPLVRGTVYTPSIYTELHGILQRCFLNVFGRFLRQYGPTPSIVFCMH
jgi:hypothetical protein